MRIPPFKEELARSLIIAGNTTRNVGRMAGINRMTAWKLSKIVISEHGPIYCQCGRSSGHKGFCGFRIANSPNRIAYLLSHMRDISIYVPTPKPVCLLSYRWDMLSLDAGGYSFVESEDLDPLELLMRKEDNEIP